MNLLIRVYDSSLESNLNRQYKLSLIIAKLYCRHFVHFIFKFLKLKTLMSHHTDGTSFPTVIAWFPLTAVIGYR